MFDRYPQNKSKSLEVENDIEWSLLIFEYLCTLKYELVDLEDGIFLIIHEFYKSLHEGSQFLSSWYGVAFIHFLWLLFVEVKSNLYK